MIRPSTVFWSAAVILVGYALFQVKYEVMQQESELARVTKKIAESREAVRVLNAEWSFLNQPARLSELAKRHLSLVPIGTAQLGSIAAIPLRGADTPPPAAALPQLPAAQTTRAQLATFKPGEER
jgi:hypothetical protein